ncbi:MAG TPA: hypothetical protein VMW46_12410 [Candidatus Desulfaltia sp.]|nr:hypothetical protein [Candidatus Desulfaltia sp.]
MTIRKACYSQICMLGEKEYVRREDGVWILDEVAVNTLDCAMANSGATLQRLMPWSPWGEHPEGMKSQFAPYVLIGSNFELSAWNSWYWPIVRKVVAIGKSYGITTVWCLADNCQFHGPTKKWSPWVTNLNGITTLYEKAAHPFFGKFIDKSILELDEFEPWYSWGNEMPDQFIDVAEKVIFPRLASGKLKPERCTYGATMQSRDWVWDESDSSWKYLPANAGALDTLKKRVESVVGEKGKLAIWKEVHGVGDGPKWSEPGSSLHQSLFWWARKKDNGIRIWLSNDGSWNGDSECDFEASTGRRRPSAPRMKMIAETARAYGNDIVIEHLPKGGDLGCQKKTVSAIYEGLNGKKPEEKYHYEPPLPELPTPPEPEPEPPPPQSCYERFIKGRPFWKWQIGKFIRCLF